MKQWYSFYYEDVTKSHQAGGQFGMMTKRHQLGDELEMPEIFVKIPWKHHVHIFSKCHSVDEALFYIKRVVEEGWSRSRPEDQVAANLYARQNRS